MSVSAPTAWGLPTAESSACAGGTAEVFGVGWIGVCVATAALAFVERRIRYLGALGFVVIELFRFFQGVKQSQLAVI